MEKRYAKIVAGLATVANLSLMLQFILGVPFCLGWHARVGASGWCMRPASEAFPIFFNEAFWCRMYEYFLFKPSGFKEWFFGYGFNDIVVHLRVRYEYAIPVIILLVATTFACWHNRTRYYALVSTLAIQVVALVLSIGFLAQWFQYLIKHG